MWMKTKKILPFMLIAALLPACGGGGGGDDNTGDDGGGSTTTSSLDYSGETSEATLTSENSKELATAGASGAKQAINADSVPVVGQRSDAPVSRDEIMQEFAGWMAGILQGDASGQAARGVTAARTQDLSQNVCDTGSLIIEYPDSGTAGNWRVEYNQCTRTANYGSGSYSSTFDGTVEGTYTEVGGGYRLEFRYVNFTVSVHSATVNYTNTFNMSMTCTASNTNGTDVSCEYYSDYRGYDNRTYRVSEVSVSGSASSGYSVSVRVYDPDYGYVTVTTEIPVTFGCSDGHPDAGRIRMQGANGTVATVEFISCTQYVVTFEGVGSTHTWP